jgi:hypothetical protein
MYLFIDFKLFFLTLKYIDKCAFFKLKDFKKQITYIFSLKIKIATKRLLFKKMKNKINPGREMQIIDDKSSTEAEESIPSNGVG